MHKHDTQTQKHKDWRMSAVVATVDPHLLDCICLMLVEIGKVGAKSPPNGNFESYLKT